MKKIYYLIAFVIAAAAFSACKPLSKTYDTLGDVPGPAAPSFPVTLVTADYKILNKGAAANVASYFKSTDTAKIQIPAILASKYPTLAEKSSIAVTYSVAPVAVKLVDSLNADDAYTLTTTPANDYTLLPGNTFTDFSTAQAITWLPYKFGAVTENTLKVLTYQYFESGKTSNAGVLQTDAYLFMGGIWQKIYRVSNAQYASVGNGVNNWFIAADAANIVPYINSFLKADATIAISAKVGQVIYVNYRYLTTYQRIVALTFDGTNWTTNSNPVTLQFVKTNGVWVADNTITYKLIAADYTFINSTSVNIATARANVASFGDFNISMPLSATTGWSDADINTVIGLILSHDFPAAVVNQKFVISYLAYNGATITVVKTFVYNGTSFIYTP